MHETYVYILASKPHGTLYIGVTRDLVKRASEHRNDLHAGFPSRYSVHRLVYYEVFNDIKEAIFREKQLKKWNRKWKKELIERENPRWDDLYDQVVG